MRHLLLLIAAFGTSTLMSAELPVRWYYEDANTAGETVRDNSKWDVDEGTLEVIGDRIKISADFSDDGNLVSYIPTNSVGGSVTGSRIKFSATFESATELDSLPDPKGRLFGITVITDSSFSNFDFAIVSNNAWTVLDKVTPKPELSKKYDFDLLINEVQDHKEVVYRLVDENHELKTLGSSSVPNYRKARPAAFDFYGNGSIYALEGRGVNDAKFDLKYNEDFALIPSTNFAGLAIAGSVVVSNLVDATSLNNVTSKFSVVCDFDEQVFGEVSVPLTAKTNPVVLDVKGLEQGKVYTLKLNTENLGANLVSGDTVIDRLTPMARPLDSWVVENWQTFKGKLPKTGKWTYTEGEAVASRVPVVGRSVKIDSQEQGVGFAPTSREISAVESSVRELRFTVRCNEPGYYYGEEPVVEFDDVAGITVVCDDTVKNQGETYYFAVLDNGNWKKTECSAWLDYQYEVAAVLDYHHGLVTYYVLDGEKRHCIASCALTGERKPTVGSGYNSSVRFIGAGAVATIVGNAFDANLTSIGGSAEYWTMQDAIEANPGTNLVVSPLWYSTYEVADDVGRFGVKDPNGLLSILWKKGQLIDITKVGDITYYTFRLSDNWIDYADAEGVELQGGTYVVKTEKGLAYIAKLSQSSEVDKDIRLSRDLNLAKYNWTPIAAFKGTFDGGYHTITGLTTVVGKGYALAPTNCYGMTAYGLISTATNSVLQNVAFEQVAITNNSDAVAALLGASLGELMVTNVAVNSGELVGKGAKLAAVVGYAEAYPQLTLNNNTNLATLINLPTDKSSVSAVAGIATVGGNTAASELMIKGNVNGGVITTEITSNDEGGNVAQIVAGAKRDAKFGTVTIKDNIADADMSGVVSKNHSAYPIGNLPVVNLASAVTRQSEEYGYYKFIEATNETSVAVDPVKHTARMSAAVYQNGEPNPTGVLNDKITAATADSTITLDENLEIHSPIVLDRPLTLDLNSKIIDQVFDAYAFQAEAGVSPVPTVQNGTVIAPKGKLKVGDITLNNITEVYWDGNYWERGAYVNGEWITPLSVPTALSLMTSGAKFGFYDNSAIGISDNELTLVGNRVASLPTQYEVEATVGKDGLTEYAIKLKDSAEIQPVIALDLSGNVGTIVISNVFSAYEYALQSKVSLLDDWTTSEPQSVEKDGGTIVFEVNNKATSGFFQIKVTEKIK